MSFIAFELIKQFLDFQVVERDWNSWDDAPRTISEHIEVYRENLVKPKDPEPVNEIDTVTEDLFAELAPKIVKQQKIYLNQGAGGGGDDNQDNFSRLSAGVAAEIPISVNINKNYDNFDTKLNFLE